MTRRTQGTFRAILMIAGVIVPVIFVAWLAYHHYVEGRREYLTRLHYRELRIASDQLQSRANGIARSWRGTAGTRRGTQRLALEAPAVACPPRQPRPPGHGLPD